jgi:integrase
VFTETWLQSLLKKPPPTRREDIRELGRKGHYLRWNPGGSLTFGLRYGTDGKRWAFFGNYPAMSLTASHIAHAEAREWLNKGLDPAEELERKVGTAKQQRDRARETEATTARNVVAEWAWHYARKHRKRPREAVRLARVYFATPWAKRPASELTKRDAVLLLDRIVARGSDVMARRVLSLGLQIFDFAVARDLLTVNPFRGVPRPGESEAPRQRKLIDDEIRAFWHALDNPKARFTATQQVKLALKLILVTGQRPGEVAGAAWSEFDGDRWVIPPERIKSSRRHKQRGPHEVPLSPLAVELLGELRVLSKDRLHVFPSVHAKQKRDKSMLELALSRALRNNRKSDGTVLGLPWFTPHDLRRSAASGMTRLGTTRLHVSKVLNHSDRDVTGRHYDQHDYWKEKATALDAWGEHLRAVIAGKAPKVVPLRKGAMV